MAASFSPKSTSVLFLQPDPKSTSVLFLQSDNRRRHWFVGASRALTPQDFAGSGLGVQECLLLFQDAEKVVTKLQVEKKVRPKTVAHALQRLPLWPQMRQIWLGAQMPHGIEFHPLRTATAANEEGEEAAVEEEEAVAATAAAVAPSSSSSSSSAATAAIVPPPRGGAADARRHHKTKEDEDETAEEEEAPLLDSMLDHLDAIRRQMLALKRRLLLKKKRRPTLTITAHEEDEEEAEDDDEDAAPPPTTAHGPVVVSSASDGKKKACRRQDDDEDEAPAARILWLFVHERQPQRPPIRLSLLRNGTISQLYFHGVWIPDYDLDDATWSYPEDMWSKRYPTRGRRYRSECKVVMTTLEEQTASVTTMPPRYNDEDTNEEEEEAIDEDDEDERGPVHPPPEDTNEEEEAIDEDDEDEEGGAVLLRRAAAMTTTQDEEKEDDDPIMPRYLPEYDIDDLDPLLAQYPFGPRPLDEAVAAVRRNNAGWLRFVERPPPRPANPLTALRTEPVDVLYALGVFAPGYDLVDAPTSPAAVVRSGGSNSRKDRFLRSEFLLRDQQLTTTPSNLGEGPPRDIRLPDPAAVFTPGFDVDDLTARKRADAIWEDVSVKAAYAKAYRRAA